MDVKGIVKKQGFTLERVASEMGVTRVTLSQTLSRNPTVKTLQRIADIIGCKVGDFFADDITTPTGQNSLTCPKCGCKLDIDIKEKE